jgi:sortase (surface protein transpeptidase)
MAGPRGRAGAVAVAAGIAVAVAGTVLTVDAHSATTSPVGSIPAADVGHLPLPGRLPGPAPVAVRIPSIGVNAPVMAIGLHAGAIAAPADGHLVGWWDGSPPPGSVGPAVLAGHVDSAHSRAVFYGLRSVRPGAAVFIERSDGSTVRFTIDAIREYPSNNLPRETLFGSTSRPSLRLITCGDYRWITGHFQADVVVFAHAAATSWSV